MIWKDVYIVEITSRFLEDTIYCVVILLLRLVEQNPLFYSFIFVIRFSIFPLGNFLTPIRINVTKYLFRIDNSCSFKFLKLVIQKLYMKKKYGLKLMISNFDILKINGCRWKSVWCRKKRNSYACLIPESLVSF